MKHCSKCGDLKPLDEFHKDASRKDGRTSSCRVCRTKHTLQYHKDNQTWKSESNKQFNKRRMQTPEAKVKAVHASTKWQRENPHKSVPYNRANASMKRVSERYPDAMGCTIEDIIPFYEKAFEMEQKFGGKYHVDHKIPLMAGGKHDPSNLEVLSEEAHKEKTRQEFAIMRELMTQHYKE